MTNLQRVIETVLQLHLRRGSWIHREISSLDLDVDESSYEQKFTIDIDISQIRRKCSNYGLKHAYFPVYWRRKGPMYSISCRAADGRALQILNREFNEKFSEDLFWKRCNVQFKNKLPEISESLKEFVRDGVCSTVEEIENCRYPSDNLDKSDKDVWNKLMKDVAIRNLWTTILECHIVVVRVPKQADGSIVKLSEIRNYDVKSASQRFRFNPFSPVVKVVCNVPSPQRVKLLVPKDVRILRCRAAKDKHLIKMEVFGNGHWARRYSNKAPGSSDWNIYLAPKRSDLLVPGFVMSIIALISCYFWWHLESKMSGKLADNVLFAFMLTILPVLAGVVLSRSSSSYIYRRATGSYVWHLLTMSVLWFAFTALPTTPYSRGPFPLIPKPVSQAIVSIIDYSRELFLALICLCLLLFAMAIVASTERITSFFITNRNKLIRFMLQNLQSRLTE